MDMQAKRTPANNDNPVVRFISAFSLIQVLFYGLAGKPIGHGLHFNPLSDVAKLPAYADYG